MTKHEVFEHRHCAECEMVLEKEYAPPEKKKGER